MLPKPPNLAFSPPSLLGRGAGRPDVSARARLRFDALRQRGGRGPRAHAQGRPAGSFFILFLYFFFWGL